MNALFADTSYYFASLNPNDADHDIAVELSRRYRGSVVTTEYVVAELGNFMSRGRYRAIFV